MLINFGLKLYLWSYIGLAQGIWKSCTSFQTKLFYNQFKGKLVLCMITISTEFLYTKPSSVLEVPIFLVLVSQLLFFAFLFQLSRAPYQQLPLVFFSWILCPLILMHVTDSIWMSSSLIIETWQLHCQMLPYS